MNATENTLLLMNTAPIRSVIAHMLVALKTYMRSDASLNKKCERVRKLMAFYRILITMESYNREKILRAKMLANPAWRAQVYADLGGWFAMRHWNKRMRGAHNKKTQNPPPHTAQLTASSDALETRPTRVKNSVKTDRRGQFRLAPIPLGARETMHQRCERPARESSSRIAAKPIPVWPHDFTDACNEDATVAREYNLHENDHKDHENQSGGQPRPLKTTDPPPE